MGKLKKKIATIHYFVACEFETFSTTNFYLVNFKLCNLVYTSFNDFQLATINTKRN